MTSSSEDVLDDYRQDDASVITRLQDELAALEMAYQHLEGAIASSRRVGAAVGIVMAAMGIGEEQAFGFLVKISRRRNRGLRLVAEDIVSARTL